MDEAAFLASSLGDCAVCFELLFEPYTGPCGHSFCRRCVVQSLSHARRCPTCRTAWSGVPDPPPTTAALAAMLARSAPVAYAARRAEAPPLPPVRRGSDDEVGLFALDHVLPRQRLTLHVFEPRYRSLVRNALARTPPTFGVVGFAPSGDVAAVFSACEIVHHVAFADGRYEIEVVARARRRIARDWVGADGYRVARTVPLVDDSDDDDADETSALAAEVRRSIDALWLPRVRARRGAAVVDGVLGDLGEPPADAEAFGLWAAALLNPLPALGVAPELRHDALRVTSSLARLKIVSRCLALSVAHLDRPPPLLVRVVLVSARALARASAFLATPLHWTLGRLYARYAPGVRSAGGP